MKTNIQMTGERLETIWPSYRMPSKFVDARLDNYYPTEQGQNMALNRCIEYSRQDINTILGGQGLFLHGPIGTGKTHLAIATVHEIVKNNVEIFGYKSNNSNFLMYEESNLIYQYQGIKVGFKNVTELLTTLQESFSGNERAKIKAIEMLHQAKVADILILDDLGAMKPSEWVETQLYNLINIRYNMERPMLITSNCSIKDIEIQLGERIVSRLFEVTQGISVPGRDFRKRKLG